jgi:hypothetical protein
LVIISFLCLTQNVPSSFSGDMWTAQTQLTGVDCSGMRARVRACSSACACAYAYVRVRVLVLVCMFLCACACCVCLCACACGEHSRMGCEFERACKCEFVHVILHILIAVICINKIFISRYRICGYQLQNRASTASSKCERNFS